MRARRQRWPVTQLPKTANNQFAYIECFTPHHAAIQRAPHAPIPKQVPLAVGKEICVLVGSFGIAGRIYKRHCPDPDSPAQIHGRSPDPGGEHRGISLFIPYCPDRKGIGTPGEDRTGGYGRSIVRECRGCIRLPSLPRTCRFPQHVVRRRPPHPGTPDRSECSEWLPSMAPGKPGLWLVETAARDRQIRSGCGTPQQG